MRYVIGNLLDMFDEGYFRIIGQGCNCFNTMGSGIAAQIAHRYPQVYVEDCKTVKGDRNKLGTYTQYEFPNSDQVLLNCYSQYTFWDKNDMFSYDALHKVLTTIKNDFNDKLMEGKCIAFPLIGAGLAQGNWKLISEIFEEVAIPNCYIVVWNQDEWDRVVAPIFMSRKDKLIDDCDDIYPYTSHEDPKYHIDNCPFCDGEMNNDNIDYCNEFAQIECNCGASIKGYDVFDCINKWNNRRG